jgi:hypothetical protein
VAVAILKLYIKKIIIKYYPAAVITEPRVSIKTKFITFINTSYVLIKSREDIKIKNAQNKRRLKELRYS